MARLSAALVVATAMVGCTFGDLASYRVAECTVDPVDQAHDDCDHLNTGGAASCTPWQCDPLTRHCVRRPRDDDKDGDPARQCGGRDCDDHDPSVNGLALGEVSVVEQIDSATTADAEIAIRGGALPTASVRVPTTGGECIQLLSLNTQPAGHLTGSCTLLGNTPSLAPVQVSARTDGTLSFAAFVSTSACATGALAYADASASVQGLVVDSACDRGALLPTVERAGTDMLVADLAAPFFAGAAADCLNPTPVPLRIRRVMRAAESKPVLGDAIELTTAALTECAPSLFVTDEGKAIVAAATASAAHLWLLDSGLTVLGDFSIDALSGAHEFALAARASTNPLRLAVAAATGCPSTAIAVTLLDLDLATGVFTVAASANVTVLASGTAVEPTIGWSSTRRAWLVTWYSTTAPQGVMARYFDDRAQPLTSELIVSASAARAAAADDGAAWLLQTRNGDAILRAPLLCP
jgi:hypothetical protein